MPRALEKNKCSENAEVALYSCMMATIVGIRPQLLSAVLDQSTSPWLDFLLGIRDQSLSSILIAVG